MTIQEARELVEQRAACSWGGIDEALAIFVLDLDSQLRGLTAALGTTFPQTTELAKVLQPRHE